jgi:hypothetical protein
MEIGRSIRYDRFRFLVCYAAEYMRQIVRFENYDLNERTLARPCLYYASNVAMPIIRRMLLHFSCKYDST